MLNQQKLPAFKKGFKKFSKSGNVPAMKRLKEVLGVLLSGGTPDAQRYNLHPLHGVQKGLYGLHVTPDHQWVLVFSIEPPITPDDPGTLVLHCLGPHQECYKYKK